MTERVKILTWENISLVVPEKQDVDLWYRWVNDIETSAFILVTFWKITYREDEEDYYEKMRNEKDGVVFCIYLEKEKKVIWNVWLSKISYMDMNCMLWISIFDKDNQDKWYGTEAMKLVLKYAFEVLGLNKVKLNYVDFNTRAKKIYEKLWFKEVWRLKNEKYMMWKFHDDVIMEIFKEEFKL